MTAMPVKTMQKMLSRREKIQKLIDNLEAVRTGGETDEGQYNMLKAQYEALRVQADDNLKHWTRRGCETAQRHTEKTAGYGDPAERVERGSRRPIVG